MTLILLMPNKYTALLRGMSRPESVIMKSSASYIDIMFFRFKGAVGSGEC